MDSTSVHPSKRRFNIFMCSCKVRITWSYWLRNMNSRLTLRENVRKVVKVQLSLTKDLRKIKIGKSFRIETLNKIRRDIYGIRCSSLTSLLTSIEEKVIGLSTHLSYLRGNSFSHIFTLNFIVFGNNHQEYLRTSFINALTEEAS